MFTIHLYMYMYMYFSVHFVILVHLGYIIFFPDPRTGLFSVKIWKIFLAIKNFSVNDTMSGQPNKRLIH